jgi:gluconokinase
MNAASPAKRKTLIVVMGVAGSGKTTVGQILARRLGWSFAEADDFHSAANVAKMASGIPLTDEDRRPWLESIRSWADASPGDSVITCSALRRSYRDILRGAQATVRFASTARLKPSVLGSPLVLITSCPAACLIPKLRPWSR